MPVFIKKEDQYFKQIGKFNKPNISACETILGDNFSKLRRCTPFWTICEPNACFSSVPNIPILILNNAKDNVP